MFYEPTVLEQYDVVYPRFKMSDISLISVLPENSDMTKILADRTDIAAEMTDILVDTIDIVLS